ncbi:MAG: hypothetical protein ACFCGT_06090 [Sandaracinaceae bacterium]
MPASPSPEGDAPTPNARRRVVTAFGWVAGICAGVLVNYPLYLLFGGPGSAYPVALTTFVAVAAGGFGGLALADRLGEQGLRPLGLAAGLLLALLLGLVVMVTLAPGATP